MGLNQYSAKGYEVYYLPLYVLYVYHTNITNSATIKDRYFSFPMIVALEIPLPVICLTSDCDRS